MKKFLTVVFLLCSIAATAQTHTFPALDTTNAFTGTNTFAGLTTFNGVTTFNSTLFSADFNQTLYIGDGINFGSFSDLGQQANAAYAALPTNGGNIVVLPKSDGSCYNFSTPIVFATSGKYVLFEYSGAGGLLTAGNPGTWSGCLNYTPITATSAITLDYATVATDSLSPVAGLKNIILVNNNCATTGGCGSSAIGIAVGNTNHGIQSATLENITVVGFSVGYQNTNFYSDPALWLNPTFFGNGTAWIIGNVSTHAVVGGFFTGNGIAFAAPSPAGSYNSETSFYGTTFVLNTSWDFDYSNNNVCCAKLDLFGVHLEQFMAGSGSPPAQRILQGKVDFFMSGGTAEDDNGSGSSDYWFNAQGNKFTLQDVEIQTALNTPSVGIVNDATTTRVKVSVFVKNPGGGGGALPCTSIVGGGGTATQEVSEFNTSVTACTWSYESGLSTPTLTSTITTGTAPLTVTSTTPVAHLSATPTTYNAAGTQQVNTHLVIGTCTLGTTCGVTLSGSAAYTTSSSYVCSATDQTGIFAARVNQTAGNGFTITGNSTDVIGYVCDGD